MAENARFIDHKGFKKFIEQLVESERVVGPKAKKKKFEFGQINSFEDLRLDYDTTILPPKKEFFPPEQDIVWFRDNHYEGCIEPERKILFGVHFYDIKAIDITDRMFAENLPDENYLSNRRATTIVGSNIISKYKRAFWASLDTNVDPQGHDAFITKLQDGYLFEFFTDKGEDLKKFGDFVTASDEQINSAAIINDNIKDNQPEFKYSPDEIATKVRSAYTDNELWDRLAENCFSCGSCNIVCPTCYCFDVQDNWDLNQKSGVRTRYWDACLTKDFAAISLGEGKSENFRDKRGERFRHRIMRKVAYLNEKLGGPACVGCGRCAGACASDIANPVEIIKTIMEGEYVAGC